jgi:hypothetical protein
MASINWIVTEISNSVGIPNNVGFIEAARETILHVRNEQIRQSYENHHFIDAILKNRIPIKLQVVPDGDIAVAINDMLIKRSVTRVPRPTRLTNNLPFDRVSTTGARTNVVLAYAKEATVRYIHSMQHFCNPTYDYINGYIYVYSNKKAGASNDFNTIQIESAFEWNMPLIKELFYSNDMEYDIYNDVDFMPDDLVPMCRTRVLAIAMPYQSVRGGGTNYETNEDDNKTLEG